MPYSTKFRFVTLSNNYTILYIIFLGISTEKCLLKDNINIIILNQADKQTMLVCKCVTGNFRKQLGSFSKRYK